MDYKEQLQNELWFKKRNEILKLHDYTCAACGYRNVERGMNVHHKIYFKQLMAWEYEPYYLIVLCDECHKTLHEGLSLLDHKIRITYCVLEQIALLLSILDDIDLYLNGSFESIADTKKLFSEFFELQKKLRDGGVC